MSEGLKFNQIPPTVQENHDKIDLSQFGLKKDSWLEKKLNGQDKEEIKAAISSVCEKSSRIFGSNSERITGAIFAALDKYLVSRCESPEDFSWYAEVVLDAAKLQIKYKEKGIVDEYQWFDTEKIESSTFSIVDIAQKAGGDFRSQVETLSGMMKDSIDLGYQDADVLGMLWSLNRDGLELSESSLMSIREIVRNSAERGFDVRNQLKNLFGNNYANITDRRNAYGNIYEPDETFKNWRGVSRGRFGFSDRLRVMEESFRYDLDPISFVKDFNAMTVDEQGVFVSRAKNFASKGVPPQAALSLGPSCNLSKEGLAVFQSLEDQKHWLGYCAHVLRYNPKAVEKYKSFFNEALSPQEIELVVKKEWEIGNIKGLSSRELAEVQKDTDDEFKAGEFKVIKEIEPNPELKKYASGVLEGCLKGLYADSNFDAILKIKDSISASAELVSALDAKESSALSNSDLIRFITSLGSEKEKILPLTFAQVRKMIPTALAEDVNLADYFLENLDNYFKQPWVEEDMGYAIQYFSVAQKFVTAVEGKGAVWIKESWVPAVFIKAKNVLDKYYASQWDQSGEDKGVYKYRHGSEGLSPSDPYEKHSWRFTGEQAQLSVILANAIGGDTEAIRRLGELGMNLEADGPLLPELDKKIMEAYGHFLETVRLNPKIRQDDKNTLLNPETSQVRMTALQDTVRSLVARYVAQCIEGDVARIPEIRRFIQNVEGIVAEGFNKYIKVHEVEIPLYDKLYEEFDSLRETGRYPLEVFLGRDGIYAWIGRRSQDVARRRKAGLEGRRELRKKGEILEIHPKYTVYPRYFRDNINYETKRKFLEQEGISKDADPLFYDTGYTGTIPEQIMKIMGFDDEEIEKRIRLLSAPYKHRRVKGVTENARKSIIEHIEHNSKTVEAAEGLVLDEKTDKMRPIAKPTSPEEQFYFMMIKQAISRHYWLQEKLYHEPSGNMNLDSEHYTIRIRQEYAKVLPSDFVKDPKDFLAQHGELLKGSRGGGEFPDEEITLFKMTDGTEIVAKKIELRKAKEARKEFSILISAKKAGLPTAEPVGFVSGKEEKDGSYLLMKKIEGISGRNFDKYLMNLDKFNEDQVKAILKRVSEKNKEMAELFREKLGIDKRWRIKDTIIEFDQETGEVGNVTPIDWERAQNFNPNSPKEIDEMI